MSNMYSLEKKTPRDDRFLKGVRNPSFSSILLDKIYHSIDEGERNSGEMKFYRETTLGKKQSRSSGKCNRAVKEEDMAAENLRRACLLEKWMDKKISEKFGSEMHRKLHYDRDHDQDALFFSSTSISSDSSSGGFSSSDTESSLYGARSQSSCFAPPRPRPVRAEKAPSERRHSALFDGCCHSSKMQCIASGEEGLIKCKSRALQIYNNLKKVKQPISPGGKLTNFLNSLFTTGNAKKTKITSTSSVGAYEDVISERKAKSAQASTCSSASSFSRSCLNKTSSSISSREKLCNGVKRTVRFYPVSVILDEDCRPCGHKCLYEGQDTRLVPVSVPTAWKIGRSPTKKKDEELKFPIMETKKRVQEAASEFLEGYHHHSRRKNDLILSDEEDDYEDDDAASYSSSDLFELDHLSVTGNGRFCEELPVYETTHVHTNRAIDNGLI